MKKIISILAVMAMTASMLTGCGASSEAGQTQESSAKAVTADVNALGDDLRNKITYQDDLAQMDAETVAMFINLDGVSVAKACAYESSGATAEEIVVLECASSDDAKKAASAFKVRVAEQKESFENYVPEELTKLGNAVIATSGCYAVLSVSDDADTAKSVISEYLK